MSKTSIKYFQNPLSLIWIDGEVTLFEQTIYLHDKRTILIDASITSEIMNGPGYNTFRLYIDNVQVTQGGYEAELPVFAPNLSEVSLTYGDKLSCRRRKVTVKVTAQITGAGAASNVDNTIGRFIGTKGAFLRIFLS